MTVSIDPQIKVFPDIAHKYTLAYSHGALSTDQINIQLDNGVLKTLSTTSNDQTVDLVKGINTLLGQVATTASAVSKARTSTRAPAATETPPCAVSDMKVSATKDITYGGRPQRSSIDKGQKDCEIRLTITVEPRGTLGVTGYPRDDTDVPGESVCNQAVCFRLAGAYTVTATAILVNKSTRAALNTTSVSADMVAPNETALGFVRFERRWVSGNGLNLRLRRSPAET